MVSENEKKLKREILLLRQQISQKDREIFKLTNKNRNLKRENEKIKEDSEKQKNVHNIRYKRIHQRRKFKVADYEKEIEKLGATIKRLKRERHPIIPTSSNIITSNHPSKSTANVTHRRKNEKSLNLTIIVEATEFEELQTKYVECENERDALKSIVEDLAKKNNDLAQAMKEQEIKCNELQSKIDDQGKKLINYEIQLKTKDDIIAELHLTNAGMEEKICDYQLERNALISTVGVLTRRNDNLNYTVKEQATKIEELESAFDLNKTRLEIQLKTTIDILVRLQYEYKNLRIEKQMIQIEFNDRGNRLIKLENLIESMNESNAALRTKYDKTKKCHDEVFKPQTSIFDFLRGVRCHCHH